LAKPIILRSMDGDHDGHELALGERLARGFVGLDARTTIWPGLRVLGESKELR
jgi:hypothetical protein